jgi:hypothetical protein
MRQGRRILKLGFRDVGVVPFEAGVVVQLLPGHGVEVRFEPEEPSKPHDSVHNTTADFLNDEMIDSANVLAFTVIDAGALDTIALDQRMSGSACF